MAEENAVNVIELKLDYMQKRKGKLMEPKEFERLAKLEQKQINSIEAMDKHVAQDLIMLGEIRSDIKDIYEKLTNLVVSQTKQSTIMWLIGALIVLITPTITAIVVAYMMAPHK